MKFLAIFIAFLCIVAVLALCWISIKMLNQAQKGTLPSEPEKAPQKDSVK